MFRGFTSIVYKESIHILRDPRTLFLMLFIPGLQLTIFGYAIDMDVKHIPTVVYNLDGRADSRALIDTFRNSGTFDIVGTVNSDYDMMHSVIQAKAKVAIKIPPDYTDRLLTGAHTEIQILIDGGDSTVAMNALNVSNAIALRKSLSVLAKSVGVGQTPPIEARPRMLFNPDMKTANFMVPGLVGIVMQVVTMFLTAFAIVREKENGTFEQLMVTPVSRLGLMMGKLMPYAFVGTIETTFIVIIMRYLFGVHIAGSLALLGGLSLIFLFTALGLGLLISTLATTQMQAIQFSFVIMLPSVLLSGFVFPQESMPLPIYVIGQLIPATYFIRILRGIILRGAGIEDLWVQAVILAGFGLVILTLGTNRLRKTMG
ncbi:MAG: ABC transporter permease [Candidatus Hydrogenedentes bacterium]|nr:ABC transporter permease [Candidatus Hydrogenedentota bacterium]